MAKKKATKRRAPAKKAAAPKRRRRAPAKKAAAPKRRRRRAASSSAPKRRRRRRNPSVKGISSWAAETGYGVLGMAAAGFGAGLGQMAAGMVPVGGGFLTSPLSGGSDSNPILGEPWTPAQYMGATLVAWQGAKLLPKRTKPSHVTAFRIGAAVLPGAKAFYTEVVPRIPGFAGKEVALGATVGYDANGQAWLRQGNGYVAMQGMGSMLHQSSHLDGMGQLVEAGPYDSEAWLEPTAVTTPVPASDSGMSGF